MRSGKSTPPEKRILIIAGPNGAGKTTFAQELLPHEPGAPVFLNADEIAAELCPRDPASVAVRAGRLMLERIATHVEAGRSFAIETTLSGRTYAQRIPRWRDVGYKVSLYFLTVPEPAISIARVAARVRHGGHDIPEPAIRRRFDKGLKNFYSLYRDLVDEWALYDTSDRPPRSIASGAAD